MGLKSHKTGVKAQLRERFPGAFREYPLLIDARNAACASRSDTVVHVDGNVLFHGVPQSARSLDDFVAVIYSSLLSAISTAVVTVVVFDEPEVLTKAKLMEQAKRDAQRASVSIAHSADLSWVPTDDNYTRETMNAVADVHALKANRGTRQRFFDEVAVVVFQRLVAQIKRWEDSGYDGGCLLFDGIDARGASRPVGEPRSPGMVASRPELADTFERDAPIGEGDLKLRDLGERVRRLAREADGILHGKKLILVSSIDTDSFAIELVEEARRAGQAVTPANTLLCLRERAYKRGTEEERPAFYLCCDVALLHRDLQRLMWGRSHQPSPLDQRCAASFLVAGWASCGCDFVEVKGMRSDVVFDAVAEIVKTRPDVVSLMSRSWTGRAQDMDLVEVAVKKLLVSCASKLADIPRARKAVVSQIMNVEDVLVKRVAWTVSYWQGTEYKSVELFGFSQPFAA